MVHFRSTTALLAATLCSVLPTASAAQEALRPASGAIEAQIEPATVGPLKMSWPSSEGVVVRAVIPPQVASDTGSPPLATFVGSLTGSVLGQIVGGTLGYYALGVTTDSFDGGIFGALAGSALGGALGAGGLGAFVGNAGEEGFGRAFGGSLVGTAVGLGLGLVGNQVTQGYLGWFVGMGFGQALGATVSLQNNGSRDG